MDFQKNIYKKVLSIVTLLFTILNLMKMKKIMFSALVMATIFMSCGSNNTETAEHEHDGTHQHDDATHEHHGENEAAVVTSKTASFNDLVTGYLKIKNALTTDDAENAAKAGKELFVTIASIDETSFSDAQKKVFDEVLDDAKENAEHIGANADKLEHQREHFAMLSKDVDDLIKVFGTDQKLYQDFCPMYDDGKGAIWISETKDIKNPYYGSKMLSCGKIKKEL